MPRRLLERSASDAPAKPAFIRTAAELRQHVARLGAEKVAEVLRVALADLEPMLVGRIGLSRDALLRLRQTPE